MCFEFFVTGDLAGFTCGRLRFLKGGFLRATTALAGTGRDAHPRPPSSSKSRALWATWKDVTSGWIPRICFAIRLISSLSQRVGGCWRLWGVEWRRSETYVSLKRNYFYFSQSIKFLLLKEAYFQWRQHSNDAGGWMHCLRAVAVSGNGRSGDSPSHANGSSVWP